MKKITVPWLPGYEIVHVPQEKFPALHFERESKFMCYAGKKFLDLGVLPPCKGLNGGTGTHGNFALRLKKQSPRVLLTATKSNKGDLKPNDFVLASIYQKVIYAPEGELPSSDAEPMLRILEFYRELNVYFHFHYPLAVKHQVKISHGQLKDEEWRKLDLELAMGVRAVNLLNHVSKRRKNTPDAAIVVGENPHHTLYYAKRLISAAR